MTAANATALGRLGPLVDHHCHGLVTTDLDRAGFEALMNEGGSASPRGSSWFDSMLGLAIRRHCAPVLDLEPLAPAADYLARRRGLGAAEAARRLLAATGIDTFVVDTGLDGPGGTVLTPPADLAALVGGRAHEVVRLERLMEEVLSGGTTDVVGEVEHRLSATGAVAAKSVAAYRCGLDLPGAKPTADEVRAALRDTDPTRLVSRTVSGWLAHTALELGTPAPAPHRLRRPRPRPAGRRPAARLTAFLRGTQDLGGPGPAAPHVSRSTGTPRTSPRCSTTPSWTSGSRSTTPAPCRSGMLREALELAPFGKLLFSTDAYGLAELYLLGALLFRRGLRPTSSDELCSPPGDLGDRRRRAPWRGLVARDNARPGLRPLNVAARAGVTHVCMAIAAAAHRR